MRASSTSGRGAGAAVPEASEALLEADAEAEVAALRPRLAPLVAAAASSCEAGGAAALLLSAAAAAAATGAPTKPAPTMLLYLSLSVAATETAEAVPDVDA